MPSKISAVHTMHGTHAIRSFNGSEIDCSSECVLHTHSTGHLAHHNDGRCEIVNSVIPAVLTAWNMAPSTSMLTALVHSSSRAYRGLRKKQIITVKTRWT